MRIPTWLRSSRKISRHPNERVYALLFQRHRLSPDGAAFRELGQTLASAEAGERGVRDYVEPRFRQLESDFRQVIREQARSAQERLTAAQEQVRRSDDDLDEKKDGGYLHRLDQKLAHHKTKEKEMEALLFPEKYLHGLIEKAVKGANRDGPLDELEVALEREEQASQTQRQLDDYKKIMHESGYYRHSTLYPPKRSYIRLYFIFCLILTVGEVAFSLSPFSNMLTHVLHYSPPFLLTLGVSAILSAALAILQKNMIHYLLFRRSSSTVLFWLLIALLWLFLVFVFSTYNLKGTSMDTFEGFSMFGLIVGSLSIIFSHSNAWTFREAAYLDSFYSTIHNHENIGRLKRDRRRFIRREQRLLAGARKEVLVCQSLVEDWHTAETEGLARIGDLKQVCISALRQGSDEATMGAIAENRELDVAFAELCSSELK